MTHNTSALFHWLSDRSSGVLMHPTSLPSKQGCGVLDSAVNNWLEFMADAGIHYWQTCPLGPTGYGDSPYQCFSAFAGNPYLIDLEPLLVADLLTAEDLMPLHHLAEEHVDFGQLYQLKWPLLFKAHAAWRAQGYPALPYGDFKLFRLKHQDWLEPYALFMAIKDQQQGQPWWNWPEELRFYTQAQKASLPEDIHLRAEDYIFCQYLFFGQWQQVRENASSKGIEIIGDAPIFVAADSADIWAHPELFQIDMQTGRALFVAGVPPDYFSEDGQLWGNPLYLWESHINTDFTWWLSRLRANFELCDVLRIDHFRAFDTYWSIRADALTARTGQWLKGPGLDFFETVSRHLPQAKLIAEDLGDLFPSVHELRDATGLPGMAILQFAFGGDACNAFLPHNLQANFVVYPGTHDNDTSLGWYRTATEKERDHVRRYLRIQGEEIGWDFVRAAYESVCYLAIIPLQDLLCLDSEARLNMPGQSVGNWQWRFSHEQLAGLHRNSSAYLHELAELYGRLPPASDTV